MVARSCAVKEQVSCLQGLRKRSSTGKGNADTLAQEDLTMAGQGPQLLRRCEADEATTITQCLCVETLDGGKNSGGLWHTLSTASLNRSRPPAEVVCGSDPIFIEPFAMRWFTTGSGSDRKQIVGLRCPDTDTTKGSSGRIRNKPGCNRAALSCNDYTPATSSAA